MKISRLTSLLLLSIIVGLVISSLSAAFSRNKEEEPYVCTGPAVVGYECPNIIVSKEAGWPFTYIKTTYSGQDVYWGQQGIEHQYFSYSTLFLDWLVWSIVCFILVSPDLLKRVRSKVGP